MASGKEIQFLDALSQGSAQGEDPRLDAIVYFHGRGMAGEEIYLTHLDSDYLSGPLNFEGVWVPGRGWVIHDRYAADPPRGLPTASQNELDVLAAARRIIRRGEELTEDQAWGGCTLERLVAEVARQRAAS